MNLLGINTGKFAKNYHNSWMKWVWRLNRERMKCINGNIKGLKDQGWRDHTCMLSISNKHGKSVSLLSLSLYTNWKKMELSKLEEI